MTETLKELALRLQKQQHDRALCSSPMFSVEHWKHNAGPDWPHEPDDDSYLAFENCQHPDCKLVRSSALAGIARPAQETYRDICVRYHNALVGYGRAGAVDLQAIEDADNAFIALDEAEAARPTRDGGTDA